MSWGYVAVAAIAVVGSMAQGDANDEAMGTNRQAQSENNKARYTQNIADNKAIMQANLSNTIRTGMRVGLLQVQRGQAKKNMIQAGIGLGAQKNTLLGAATANAAAAGTVGSSVDAVMSDISMKSGEAAAQLDANNVQQETNFDTQLQDLIMSGIDSLRGPQNFVTQQVGNGGYSSTGGAIASGLLAAGSMWASNNMSLGLGSTAPAGGGDGGGAAGGGGMSP